MSSDTADYTLNGNVSASWEDPDNRTSLGVPGMSDPVTVPGAKNAIGFTYNYDVAQLNHFGGIVSGSGTVTVNTSSTRSGDSLSDTSHIFVREGATATITSSSNKGLIGGMLDIAGAGRWDGTGDIECGYGAIVRLRCANYCN